MGSGFSEKIVRENINFERSQDPKRAMGIGTITLKEYFLSLFPGGLIKGRSNKDDLKSYALIKQKIMKSSTQIFRVKPEDKTFEDLTIALKPSIDNWFFILELKRLLGSGPDVWNIQVIDDNRFKVRVYLDE